MDWAFNEPVRLKLSVRPALFKKLFSLKFETGSYFLNSIEIHSVRLGK